MNDGGIYEGPGGMKLHGSGRPMRTHEPLTAKQINSPQVGEVYSEDYRKFRAELDRLHKSCGIAEAENTKLKRKNERLIAAAKAIYNSNTLGQMEPNQIAGYIKITQPPHDKWTKDGKTYTRSKEETAKRVQLYNALQAARVELGLSDNGEAE